MLAPHELPEIVPENEQTGSIARAELQRLGYYDERRQALKTAGDLSFVAFAGGNGVVSESLFIHLAKQHHGWDAHKALAAFRACDLDQSGALSRHEFHLCAHP